MVIPAQTIADDRVANSSILPMGSLFEIAQMVFFEWWSSNFGLCSTRVLRRCARVTPTWNNAAS